MDTWNKLAPSVIQRLSKDLNVTPQQAAGIVGQLGHESAGLQAINEYNPVVPGSRGGFGWAQWTGPRRRQFESWSKDQGLDVKDPEANYGFLVHELTNTGEKRALDAVRSSPDAISAGRAFTDTFLRPGTPAYESRDNWVKKALSTMGENVANAIFPAAQAAEMPQQGVNPVALMDLSNNMEQEQKKPIKWNDVVEKPEFQALSNEQKQAAQEQYFREVVVPQVPQEHQAAAKEQFFTEFNYRQPTHQPQERNTSEQLEQATGRSRLDEFGRQIGLTARYGLEGVSALPEMLINPVASAVGLPTMHASDAADWIGLPKPENATERVVGDVARTMAGAGGMVGVSGSVAQNMPLVQTGLQRGTQAIANTFAANPGMQLATAAGSGAGGGIARESGAGPVGQAAAAIGGGLLGAGAYHGTERLGSNIVGRINSMRPQQVLQRVREAMDQAGIDFDSLPNSVKNQLQAEATKALRTGGDLDPQMMARLADFRRVDGTVPTRSMLTQDPGQVTREMNLAKTQANVPNLGKGKNLSQIQADNNQALVRALDDMGASTADDVYSAGQKAINSLQSRISGRQAKISDLYDLARDSQGRSFPLNGHEFTRKASQLLDDNLVGAALPADVRNHLNKIAMGEVPFTVDYAEQLKTVMARLQRNSADGSTRYALGLVRQALDDAPVLPLGGQPTVAPAARAVNPGMLPATQGTELGEDAISAFTRARAANRSFMKQVENTPALRDLYRGDVAPEQFMQKYIISPSAKVKDVRRLGRLLSSEPQAKIAVRDSIAQHLKSKALSNLPDDIGVARFSPAQYTKVLKQIGDRKLAAFFEPHEIEQLHAISRVGRLTTNQPVGSAVNNSNTAAALVGRALDMLGLGGRSFKLLGIGDQIGAIQAGLAQRSARQLTPSLLQTAPQTSSSLVPATVYGSLLATPRRDDDDSN